MPEPDNRTVIDDLRAKRQQRKPPQRRASDTPAAKPAVSAPVQPVRTETPKQPPATKELQVPADEKTANYAVRVRRTLDDLGAQRLFELRQRGVRSSKVELTELLLWELSDTTPANLEERLARFRQHAPR